MFIPFPLEGLTPAQATEALAALRREIRGGRIIAVLPVGASRELAAVAKEHADGVIDDEHDYRDAMREAGLPSPVEAVERQGIRCETDDIVAEWIREQASELMAVRGVGDELAVLCAVTAWNSVAQSPRDAAENLERIAMVVSDGVNVDEPLEWMQMTAVRKQNRFPGDTRTVVDHEIGYAHGVLEVTATVAQLPPEPDTLPLHEIAKNPIVAAKFPFEAFRQDAEALNVEEDESRLPVRWLAAAQLAARFADASDRDRMALAKQWADQVVAAQADGESVWTALSTPGVVVTDLASAALTLTAIAKDARVGGALRLAYSIAMHTRVAVMDRGPAGVRARATLEQASALKALGLLVETRETYEAALEDAIRANDRELERSILPLVEEARRAAPAEAD